MREARKVKAILCKACDSIQTYVLKDKTIVCKRCGHREVKNEKK